MSILGIGEAIGGVALGAGNAALGAGNAALGAGNAVNGIAQGAGQAIAKLGDVLLSPVNLLCDWGREPMRRFEHNRQQQNLDKQVQREIEREVGTQRELSRLKQEEKELSTTLHIRRETEIARINAETEQLKLGNQLKTQQELSRLKQEEDESSTNLHIRRETEIVRIIAEIEQLKKDKELERMKAVSDAMMKYQQELTRINVDAVNAIGSMRIDLQRKAYELIHEKTQQYAELQDRAIQQAQDQLSRIDGDSAMTDSTKNILRNAVDKKLAGIIDNALRFIDQLNVDIQYISKDINLITSSGQSFIERHLSQFQVIGFSDDAIRKLTSSNNRQESLPSP